MAGTSNHEGAKTVPDVNPQLKQHTDQDYDAEQDGSVPLETVSVRQTDEREVWPMIWAVSAIVMVLIALYLLFG